ncbi:hypothetical protein [Pseudodesulfovibrio tunisiensis]|uniref:hypothetical protein n=1 Tax=Pseudodesulfovibrio tunisiensis TaxID=463192 RepID=UPI001FB3B89B|nr:hypothetical protein [Pseudodesulfovibrio tunisiensis]
MTAIAYPLSLRARTASTSSGDGAAVSSITTTVRSGGRASGTARITSAWVKMMSILSLPRASVICGRPATTCMVAPESSDISACSASALSRNSMRCP